jgi:hypothetical protein
VEVTKHRNNHGSEDSDSCSISLLHAMALVAHQVSYGGEPSFLEPDNEFVITIDDMGIKDTTHFKGEKVEIERLWEVYYKCTKLQEENKEQIEVARLAVLQAVGIDVDPNFVAYEICQRDFVAAIELCQECQVPLAHVLR